jgi:LPS sulfotransferase NodH
MGGAEEGDVVIRQDTRDGKRVFSLHAAAGADQFILHTRDAAIAQAIAFAKRHGVRVWMTNGNREFTLLENFRVASV